jgi:putative transport protein
MEWIAASLRHYPELAIFLTLAIGHWLGSFRLGSFNLGSVTGVLLAGVFVGQLGIAISPNVKAVFFIMFLFAVGYGVGPQFFKGLKSDGVTQALFAVVQCAISLLSVYAVARFLGYDVGTAAGLLSGSQTVSAVLGVATDAINRLDVPADQKTVFIDHMPVAYAVSYIFGTAGSAWLLATIGPRLMRVDLAAECKQLETQLGAGEQELGVISAARRFEVRTFRLTNERMANQTVAALEERLRETRTAIERIRQGNDIVDAEPATVVRLGDVLAVVGRREVVVQDLNIGPEVQDFELMDFPSEILDVVVTNKAVAGKTMKEIAESDIGRVQGRGVFLRGLVRGEHEMPFTQGTTVDRGDVLRIVGAKRNVERAAAELGYADRPTNATDLVFVGTGIVVGGLVGALTIQVGASRSRSARAVAPSSPGSSSDGCAR